MAHPETIEMTDSNNLTTDYAKLMKIMLTIMVIESLGNNYRPGSCLKIENLGKRMIMQTGILDLEGVLLHS